MFAKGYISNWYEEVFVIKKVKSTIPQQSWKIKKTGYKLYVKWKEYDSSFGSQIDKKRHCYVKMSYFPPFQSQSKKKKPNLSNYETTTDLKISTDIDTIPHKLLKRMIQLI